MSKNPKGFDEGFRAGLEAAAKVCAESAEGSAHLEKLNREEGNKQGTFMHCCDKATAFGLAAQIRALQPDLVSHYNSKPPASMITKLDKLDQGMANRAANGNATDDYFYDSKPDLQEPVDLAQPIDTCSSSDAEPALSQMHMLSQNPTGLSGQAKLLADAEKGEKADWQEFAPFAPPGPWVRDNIATDAEIEAAVKAWAEAPHEPGSMFVNDEIKSGMSGFRDGARWGLERRIDWPSEDDAMAFIQAASKYGELIFNPIDLYRWLKARLGVRDEK